MSGSGEILASELTSNEVGDSSMVGALLDQIPGSMVSVLADGAYDGAPVYRAIAARQPQLPPAINIPPRVTAVRSAVAGTPPSPRDQHIHSIREKGRRAWEKASHVSNAEDRSLCRLLHDESPDPTRKADLAVGPVKRAGKSPGLPLTGIYAPTPRFTVTWAEL